LRLDVVVVAGVAAAKRDLREHQVKKRSQAPMEPMKKLSQS
jgi:hypothetical protein